MELLQKALFNLPRTSVAGVSAADSPAATAFAMDKLNLSHLYGGHPTPTSSPSSPLSAPGLGLGVEAVSPSIVFDVASLVLFGTHAIPVRLKILLDRLFSVIREEEVVQILKGFGWTLEDYHRGYILKDSRSGAPLERWTMCGKEEEPIVLQQFLRFGETRPITQQLLLQELSDRHSEEQRLRAHNELKRMMERSAAAAALASPPPQQQHLAMMSMQGLQHPAAHKHNSNGLSSSARSPRDASPAGSEPQSPPMSASSPSRPRSKREAETPPPSVNGAAASRSPVSHPAASPLNKLQSMQPFDFRKAEKMSAGEHPLSSTMSPMRFPHAAAAAAAAAAGLGLHMMPGVQMPPNIASYHSAMANASAKHSPKESLKEELSSSSASSAALNLSGGGGGHNSRRQQGDEQLRKKAAAEEDGKQQEAKKKLRDNIGISYISPTTGKKRVQCNVCLKTFCDKGALKIHFSAVHLREMHKCSVDGCNMMFSSRRSRNRHSANPNPKLHTPHLRRKISPHDGRTHQGPFLPGLAALTATGQLKDVAAAMQQHTHSIPPGMLSPELQQSLHRQQMELHRLSSLYGHHAAAAAAAAAAQHQHAERKRLMLPTDDLLMHDAVAKRSRHSDSDNDERSVGDGEHSAKDEASSGTHSVSGGVGRKRKSQHPTRITKPVQSHEDDDEEEDFSSDDDDEGFEMPLDNDDELDDIDDDEDDDEDDVGGRSGRSGGSGPGQSSLEPPQPPPGDDRGGGDDDRGGDDNGQQSPRRDNGSGNGAVDEAAEENNNHDENDDDNEEEREDIPVDKENPLRCVECGLEFPNHFAVKTHFQDVHLKLMHKCTVEGCNAGFPSKRSRDRHSANLNLHRKLLSTSSAQDEKSAATAAAESVAASANRSMDSDLFARIYAENAAAAAAAFGVDRHPLQSLGSHGHALFGQLFGGLGGGFLAAPGGAFPRHAAEVGAHHS